MSDLACFFLEANARDDWELVHCSLSPIRIKLFLPSSIQSTCPRRVSFISDLFVHYSYYDITVGNKSTLSTGPHLKLLGYPVAPKAMQPHMLSGTQTRKEPFSFITFTLAL